MHFCQRRGLNLPTAAPPSNTSADGGPQECLRATIYCS